MPASCFCCEFGALGLGAKRLNSERVVRGAVAPRWLKILPFLDMGPICSHARLWDLLQGFLWHMFPCKDSRCFCGISRAKYGLILSQLSGKFRGKGCKKGMRKEPDRPFSQAGHGRSSNFNIHLQLSGGHRGDELWCTAVQRSPANCRATSSCGRISAIVKMLSKKPISKPRVKRFARVPRASRQEKKQHASKQNKNKK